MGCLQASTARSIPGCRGCGHSSRDALATLHLGSGSPTPLVSPAEHPCHGRAAGAAGPLLFLQRCGTVPVLVHGHVVGITARLRRWPLGNQVSIWPRSGPGFPISALISGIARYYSYHNNVPVPGSPPHCCNPAAGRVGRAGRWSLPRSVPQLCHGCTGATQGPPYWSGDGHRPMQSWGAKGTVTSQAATLSGCPQPGCPAPVAVVLSPLNVLGGPDRQMAGTGGRDRRHRVLPEPSPQTSPNQKTPTIQEKSFPPKDPWKCLECSRDPPLSSSLGN